MNSYKLTKKMLLLTSCLISLGVGCTEAAVLTGVRTVSGMGQTRVVFDMQGLPPSSTAEYNATKHTIKVTLADTLNNNQEGIIKTGQEQGLIKGMGFANSGKNLIVTLQTGEGVNKNLFTLDKPDRVVLDVFTDYEQKTTTNLGAEGTLLRWDRGIEAGRLRLYKVTVPKSAKMEVVNVNSAEPLSSIAINHRGKIHYGVHTEPKTDDATEGKIIINDENDLKADSTLRYLPNSGYSIKTIKPQYAVQIGKDTKVLSGINKSRGANELILYTSDFGKSTKTNVYGREVVIKNKKVIKVGKGDSPINAGEFVLSGHGAAEKALETIKVGTILNIYRMPEIAKISLVGATTYQGGTEVLENGRYVGKRTDNERGARSFIGVTTTGNLILLAIDGNSPTSVGVTTKEGAELLKEAGAVSGIEVTNKGTDDLLINNKPVGKDKGKSNSLYNTVIVI